MFLWQYERGAIPAACGITTAACDLAAAMAAPIAAMFDSRRDQLLWHWLTLTTLHIAVVSGMLASPTRFGVLAEAKTSQAANALPLVLVPAFLGPSVLTAHWMALAILCAGSGNGSR
jgi:hypothetical protein